MDTRKIIEVLRATLDASQQAQAQEQLQQVRNVNENCANLKLQSNTWKSINSLRY